MLLVLLSVMIGVTVGGPFGRRLEEPDCSQLDDGMVWSGGCGSFGVCEGGQYIQIDCTNQTVVHSRALQCTDPVNAPFPCNLPPQNCTVHSEHPGYRLPLMLQDPDGSRPLCSFYYTCSYGTFLPYQWCPQGTVYDELNQRCNNPLKVPPPCGTGPINPENGQGQYGQGQYGQGQYGRGQNGQGQNGQGQYGQGQYGQGRYTQGQYGQGQYRPGQPDNNQNQVGGSSQNQIRNPYTRGQSNNGGWQDEQRRG